MKMFWVEKYKSTWPKPKHAWKTKWPPIACCENKMADSDKWKVKEKSKMQNLPACQHESIVKMSENISKSEHDLKWLTIEKIKS